MKTELPQFVVNLSKPSDYSKSKHVCLSKRERLQAFVELACYGPDHGESRLPIVDPTDPINIRAANNWFTEHLGFLGKRDAQELKEVWKRASEEGNCSRLLFTAVKVLQGKYADF